MKILVVSDSHGDFKDFYDAVTAHNDADVIFFLGDGKKEAEDIKCLFPEKKILCVKGNCDFLSDCLPVSYLQTQFCKIMFCHGDLYGVKYSLENLKKTAEEQNAGLVLFGHTHKMYSEYENGRYYFNPGSIGRCTDGTKSYGIGYITEKGILLSHAVLK